MPINVLIVDDSAVVRQVMSEELGRESDIRVIGTAADPIYAQERMKLAWPDVIVLDIEMPRMDGITFLKKLMSERPTPVVICSSLTEKGAAITVEALSSGALGIITKPSIGVRDFLQDSSSDLVCAIRAAYAANGRLRLLRTVPPPPARPSGPSSYVNEKIQSPKLTADAILDAPSGVNPMIGTTERVVALGVSTGGVQALEQVLPALGSLCPALAIVQHMPEKFTATFAQRLNGLCKIEVKEAEHNDRLARGRALIAPGGKHLVVKRAPTHYYVEVVDGPLVSRHRPSVDVLFRSVAKCAGKNALGIIMTGMGDDGARGLKELRDAGGRTVAQDEASCIVFGMPKEAIRLGAAESVAGLDSIAGLIEAAGRFGPGAG
ncbi:protein-glutamate methylesterase/protein-glutamine glutaminase [Chitinimonas koreensis]|uniref:protein-glutamate methylesterase/protein-glutamine glutaminase n=1 Tax=Chitinimonas koreensis TaxID=356302 RepID=UPI000404D142|nr:chemotaxis response regulator protein-glutamate methylesterase [Chitinimonas koreensis]QNM95996.1 chemotaxis response regulator protein-glutamate methylesterase [Chitinimonas koreensis]